MENLLNNVDRVYTGIQNLNVQPTRGNTAIILDTLTVLERIYGMLKAQAEQEPQEKPQEAEEEVSEDV